MLSSGSTVRETGRIAHINFPPTVTAERHHNTTGRAFMGRTRELAALAEAATQPTWSGAVVVGQGGVGKTALIQEFLATRPSAATTYLRGTALTANTPYGILGLLLGRGG